MTDNQNTIDLSYRPESYFAPRSLEQEVPALVKGAIRRAYVRQEIASGTDVEDLGGIAEPVLSEFERDDLGRYHPAFMGGEYLPDLESEEVEIARIHLNSTTGDVADLRARRVGNVIHYRVVDEYGGETLDGPSERTSTQPLTLGELAEFFLVAWDLRYVFEMNEHDLAGALDFTNPSSEFYPQFAELIVLRIHEWLGD